MALPLSETNIRLLSGVPFSNDYKHSRWFTSREQQLDYFNNITRVRTLQNYKPIRVNNETVVKVTGNVEGLRNVNYAMFQNQNKWFFAFVTWVEYENANVTTLHLEIDVLQTWMFEMDFKQSFVQREHQRLWDGDGKPIINTIDEGLNYGDEYETVQVKNYVPYDDLFYLVIVAKERFNGFGSTPSINGVVQPLSYYIHPFRLDGSTPSISGFEYGNAEFPSVQDLLEWIYKSEDSVNNVVSLYVTDFIGITPQREGDQLTFNTNQVTFEYFANIDENGQPVEGGYELGTIYVKDIKSYNSKTDSMGDKYDGFKTVDESKLLMYPYALTILEDYKGNRSIIKNEFINGNDLNITVRGSMGTSNKVSYSIRDYLVDSDLTNGEQLRVSLEHSLINNNPNDLPIISDYLSAYLQGNKNSLENQRQTIMFNGAMDIISGGVGAVASARTGSAEGVVASGNQAIKGYGDAVLQIQGIEAKKKDIANLPPNLVKMGSNTSFDYGNGYKGVYVIKKQIKSEYRNILSEYFKMFGYKSNRVKVPNLRTRQNWNYVQTVACNIVGGINNDDLDTLKSVFDNGITLWHTNNVGDYSLGNGVRG